MAKKTNPDREFDLFLSYPDEVIVTGEFSSADDSIDEENRTPPPVGALVTMHVDDPGRDEEGDDLRYEVLEVKAEEGSDLTKLRLRIYGDYRIAISRLAD